MDAMPERSSIALFTSALLALSITACTPPGGPPRRPEPSPIEPRPAASSTEAPATPETGAGLGPRAIPSDPRLPTVEVEDASGKPRKGPDIGLAPVREQMKECVGGKTGVVRVRIKSEKNRTSMDIEPGSSLTDTAHRCVLETLSTVDVDDVLSRGSPSNRPSSGFTSVLRVEW